MTTSKIGRPPASAPEGLLMLIEPARLESVLGVSGKVCRICRTLTLYPVGSPEPACRLGCES